MSGHRVRSDLADYNAVRHSTVDGETLGDRYDWGAHYVVDGGAVATGVTRVLPEPLHAGQRIDVSINIGTATGLDVTAPSGTDFDGTNDLLSFSTNGQAVFESFDVAGAPEWRVTFNLGGTLAT